MSQISNCIFCGGFGWKLQTCGGDRVSVCEPCAGLGRAALDRDIQACDAIRVAGGDATPGEFLACLHLTAMAIEREADARSERRQYRKLGNVLRASFARSAFVLSCGCGRCSAVQDDTLDTFWINDRGVIVGTDLDLFDHDGDRIGVVYPGVQPDGLAAQAQSAVRPPAGFMGIGALAARAASRQAARDASSMQHWDMVRTYGPGLRDGDFWIGRDGCVIPLLDRHRVLPMTEADKLALAGDHKRAAFWRASKGSSS